MRSLYPRFPDSWSALGFTLSLVVPSIAVMQRFLGVSGLLAYCAIAPPVLFVLHRRFFEKIVPALTRPRVAVLTAGLLILLVIAFWVVNPIANSGLLGPGTDRDAHLSIGTTELLQGRYPYYRLGPNEGFISQLPGALILAIPFVLLGNGAYQNVFWMFVFAATVSRVVQDTRSALLLLIVLLLLSPVVLKEYVAGNDLFAESIYVFLFVIWMVRSVPRDDVSTWKKWLTATALGTGVSSLATFPLVLPLVLSALIQRAGLRTALQYMALTCVTFGLVTIPFFLYDPAGFTPLWTIGYVQPADLPSFVGVGFAAACVVVSLYCAMDRANGELSVMLKYCTLVLAVPVLTSMFPAAVLDAGEPDFGVAGYGLPALFFGAMAFRPVTTAGPA